MTIKIRPYVFSGEDLFFVNKIKNPQINFLDFELKVKKKDLDEKLGPSGIYLVLFREKLIYIGSWLGDYNKKKRELSNPVHKERWRKHLYTLLNRFKTISYNGNSHNFQKNEISELLINKTSPIPTSKDQKITLSLLLKNKNLFEKIKFLNFIENFYSKKKELIKKKYKTLENKNNIIHDIIDPVLKIKCTDENEEKLTKQIIFGGSYVTSVNRFKFVSEFWNDIKFRDEKNMFDDFSFCYFKFENFLTSIPDIYLKNRLIKDSKSKKEINTMFEEKFEKKLIYNFNPPANDDKHKSDKTFKINQNKSNINVIENYLNKIYNEQDFFKK